LARQLEPPAAGRREYQLPAAVPQCPGACGIVTSALPTPTIAGVQRQPPSISIIVNAPAKQRYRWDAPSAGASVIGTMDDPKPNSTSSATGRPPTRSSDQKD
jgi:hypothetical protein